MKKRVLVTGATGFVGHYIVKRLIEGGYSVSVLIRRNSVHNSTLDPFRHQVHIYEGDLNDVESLEAACHDQDVVIHAAAIVSFNANQSAEVMRVNVEGTAHLVNVSLDLKIGHLIHISSIAALGGFPGQTYFDETVMWTDKKNPTLYAESKHMAELEIWRGSAEGLDITILNPSLVIGPWDQAHHSMQIFKAITKNIPFYPSGSNGFVDVMDVADAAVLSIEKRIHQERIIINGHNLGYREMLQRIAMTMGKKGPQWMFPKSLALFGARVIRIIAWFAQRNHFFQKSILKSLYTREGYNNNKSIELLGIQYRPLEETIKAVILSQSGIKFGNSSSHAKAPVNSL